MKVLLVNGGPHEKGCTYTALREAADALEACGIETEIFWLGLKPIIGCTACGGCRKAGKCVYDDCVNEFAAKAAKADGFIFGSPVHYASISGAMTSFMDRLFYSCKGVMDYKPAAVVVSARRAGTTAALDQLTKYLSHGAMPMVTSQYWNMVHGNSPEEVRQDLEGMQIMRTLGKNMVWLLRCIEAGKNAGITLPEKEPRVGTNFIR